MNSAPNSQLKISVVMVDGSFRERFHAVDSLARQTLPSDEYEVIWVEYYDCVAPQLAQKFEDRDNFRAVCLGRSGLYHSSYCFNRGIAEARGEVVVIPDADVVAEPDFLETVWRDHEANERLVEYFHRYNESEEDHVEPVSLDHLREVCRITNPENHGACLSVRKKWLVEINGYEQHPVFASGFHANDKDVYTRLRNLGLVVRWNPDVRLYHPWHPMTGEVTPHYTPQHEMVNLRGTSLMTTAYQGIDPSRNVPAPQRFDEAARWIASLDLPLRQRAVQAAKRRIGRIGRVFHSSEARKAA